MRLLTPRLVVPLLLVPTALSAQAAPAADPVGDAASGAAVVSPEAPEPETVVAAAPTITAGDRGFSLRSADERFELRLRGYAQIVGRFFVADQDETGHDGFLLRRIRPAVQARLWDDLELRMLVDFAGGRVELLDATATWRPLDAFGLRVGKMKSPVSFERLQSPTATTFLERAYPSSVAPNRDLGAVVFGEVAGGAFGWELGAFNGAPDGASAETNPNDLFDLAGRLVVRPAVNSALPAIEGLELNAALTWGPQRATAEAPELSGYRSPGGRRFVRPVADGTDEGTAVADGDRMRLAGALAYTWAGFGLAGEYIVAKHAVTLDGTARDLTVSAWSAAARYVIGADASFEAIAPRDPVGAGGLGALEIKLRAEQLTVDGNATLFAAQSTATTLSGGLSWWLNRNVRVLGDLHHTTFTGSSRAESAENVVFATVQVGF